MRSSTDTEQSGRSIYQMLNRMLAKAKGHDLKDTTKARDWTINLVMAVRLLWSEEGPSKVYRGVRNADLLIYQRAKASGELNSNNKPILTPSSPSRLFR